MGSLDRQFLSQGESEAKDADKIWIVVEQVSLQLSAYILKAW